LKQRYTRNDVAKLAGVSPAVVSYVINQSKYVSPERTEAVRKAIEELNYRPDPYARGLKTKKSRRIAFVCDNLRNDWLEIPEKLFTEENYSVSHCFSRDGESFMQELVAQRFDGVFMMSNRYTSLQLNAVAATGIPIVLYQSREYHHKLAENIVTVAPDIYQGVSACINYLLLNGHKRIILAPPLRYRVQVTDTYGFREKAYIDRMRDNNIPLDPDLICTHTDTMETLLAEIGHLLLDMGTKNRPTAIIAGDDYVAAKILQYVKRLGMKVPDDLAIFGMDNTYLGEITSPQLSSVDFSKEAFAEALAKTMIQLIKGNHAENKLIAEVLVLRESA
jgi:DNA-binding LacI/PurR family transcriptional regulator